VGEKSLWFQIFQCDDEVNGHITIDMQSRKKTISRKIGREEIVWDIGSDSAFAWIQTLVVYDKSNNLKLNFKAFLPEKKQ
jgi:hypothetical protein